MSEERKVELLPCPFCGSKDVYGVVEDDIIFTKCNGCFATGPSIFHRRVGAEEDDWTDPWNHRPTTGVQQAIDVVEKLLDVALVAEDWSGHSYLEMALEELRALPHQPTSDGFVEALNQIDLNVGAYGRSLITAKEALKRIDRVVQIALADHQEKPQ